MHVLKVYLCGGQHINRVPFMEEWWPPLYLMTSHMEHTSIGSSFLWQESKCTREHRGKQWCVTSWLQNKNERLFMMLSFSNTQVCWQAAQSVCVCVRAYLCVWLSANLYCPLRSCPWSLKCTASSKKNRHIKTGSVRKVVRNALWGIRWLLWCLGSCGRKAERWQECSTVSFQEIKGRLYRRNPLFHGCLPVCPNNLHSSHLLWMQDTEICTGFDCLVESCWVNIYWSKKHSRSFLNSALNK